MRHEGGCEMLAFITGGGNERLASHIDRFQIIQKNFAQYIQFPQTKFQVT